MNEHAIRAIVQGLVQGVGFRYATRSIATQLGLKGWVRNLPSGSVEVVAQGSEQDVQALVRFLHNGPPHARVDAVDTTTIVTDPSLVHFNVRFSV